MTSRFVATTPYSNEGYCMGFDNNKRLDCTFESTGGMRSELSFHRNGEVDIFGARQQCLKCTYTVKDDGSVKLNCPEPPDNILFLMKTLSENVRILDDQGPLRIITETASNSPGLPSNKYYYKQVQWEKAFFDSNLKRVKDEVTLDARFGIEEEGENRLISTVTMNVDGSMEVVGQKGTCECQYKATFESGNGTINIEMKDPYSRYCESLMDKGKPKVRFVIANRAIKRLEVHMGEGKVELLLRAKKSKAFIKE